MNDTYCELIVKRKMSNKALICRFLAVAATTIAILFGMLVFNIYGLIAGFFLIWLDIVIFRNTDTEYEYQYISGELDIDIIYGKIKRKRARRFDMRKIEVMAPLNSEKLSSYRNNSNIKVMDYSSGYMDRDKYAFVIPTEEGNMLKVIFEPSEKMVEAIRYVAPSKVHSRQKDMI